MITAVRRSTRGKITWKLAAEYEVAEQRLGEAGPLFSATLVDSGDENRKSRAAGPATANKRAERDDQRWHLGADDQKPLTKPTTTPRAKRRGDAEPDRQADNSPR